MSEKDDVGYVPHRISMKQEKLYRATADIARMKKETAKLLHPDVTGTSRIEQFHGAKEILNGVAMPGRKW